MTKTPCSAKVLADLEAQADYDNTDAAEEERCDERQVPGSGGRFRRHGQEKSGDVCWYGGFSSMVRRAGGVALRRGARPWAPAPYGADK